MTHRRLELRDVTYNAATQRFEGLVTVHHARHSYRYACAIDAPITMSFEAAAAGLSKQAERRHQRISCLRSETRHHLPKTRAGRTRFDPVRWLSSLVTQSEKDMA